MDKKYYKVLLAFAFCAFQTYCLGDETASTNKAFKVVVFCHPGTADELTVEKTSLLKSRISSVLLPPDRIRSAKNEKITDEEKEASISALSTCNICECIHSSFPNGIKDGKFVLGVSSGEDQMSEGDTQHPVYVKAPKCATEKLKVKVKTKPKEVEESEEVSSVEKLGEVRKHVQRMVHVADVFDQVDQYLSHRVKILVANLAKLISEDEV